MRIKPLFLGSLLTEKNNPYLNWMHTSVNYLRIHKPWMPHFRRTSSSLWFVERRALSGLCLEDSEIQQDVEGQERRREHIKPSFSQENEHSGAEQREQPAMLSLQNWFLPSLLWGDCKGITNNAILPSEYQLSRLQMCLQREDKTSKESFMDVKRWSDEKGEG